MSNTTHVSIGVQCDNCKEVDYFSHDEALAVGSVYVDGEKCKHCNHDADSIVIECRGIN